MKRKWFEVWLLAGLVTGLPAWGGAAPAGHVRSGGPAKAAPEPGAPAARPYFSDVPPNHWAAAAVNELARLGILVGYPAARSPAERAAKASINRQKSKTRN